MDLELSSRFLEEDFCRLCLSSIYELRTLFPREANESTNMMMVTKISLLAEIIIVPSEELNARICSRCFKQLEEFETFRRRCRDSDNQIRQIRTFRQQQTVASERNSNPPLVSQERPRESTVSTSDRYGGIFDVMAYCEVTPGEHLMFFDGFVYQSESLLVWRCEVPICPCQLLVQHDNAKFWVYGTHNHEKLSGDGDKRVFKKMNQQICAYLNKLRDKIDGTINNNISEQSKSTSVQQSSAENEQEQASSSTYQSIIYYFNNGGNRPTILVDGHRYHKEATSNGVIPTQIYWRCSAKNCLGMILTTADLRNSKMHKDHNHAPLLNESFVPTESNNCVKVTTAPLLGVTSPPVSVDIPGNSSSFGIAIIKLPTPPVTVMPRIDLIDNSSQLISEMRQITSSNQIPTIGSSHSMSTVQQPTTAEALRSSSSNSSLGNSAGQVAIRCHSANTLKRREISTASPRPDKLLKTPTSAAKTPVILSQIEFYRCPNISGGIILVYRQFLYSFQPTNRYITWQCKTSNCEAKVRSGWQLEYLAQYVDHNHGPSEDHVVDLDNYLPTSDALKILSRLNPTKPRQPPRQGRNSQSVASVPPARSHTQQRRMSSWC
ncbi:uncharacterized protein LOC134223575 isoform X2 [Armigeres subalbatus]|uniref:uncharacterized protein LOC134223575 isoform X2 n=1 Tax=Armigeres subalbatus TaxID=124917 RepID=UPI002ED67C47